MSRRQVPSAAPAIISDMGRWAPKHTQEQREAVIRAQLEDGLSAEQAIALAANGELWPGPFEMSATHVRGLARQAQREGERPADRNGRAATETDRAREIAGATLGRIEQLAEPSAKDLSAAREAQRIIDSADKRAAQTRRAPPQRKKGGMSELAKRLLAEARAHDAAVAAGEPCPPQCSWPHQE